ncbi:MAG: hypothetical protein AB8F74_13460 [Saprospiraceae bacterium]
MSAKSILLSFLSVLFVLSSCTKHEPKVEAARESVMAVHDKVMPEMGTIHRLRKKINKKMRADGVTELTKANYRQIITMLDDADEGMMSWMAEFKIPKEATVAEKLEYLKSEQSKIDKVSEDMYTAIKEAELMLK